MTATNETNKTARKQQFALLRQFLAELAEQSTDQVEADNYADSKALDAVIDHLFDLVRIVERQDRELDDLRAKLAIAERMERELHETRSRLSDLERDAAGIVIE